MIDFCELGYQLDDLIPNITHQLWQRIIDCQDVDLNKIFKSIILMRGRTAMKCRSTTTRSVSITNRFPASFNPPKYAKDWIRFVDRD